MQRHFPVRRSWRAPRPIHGAFPARLSLSLSGIAAALLVAVAFGSAALAPKPAQASCNFNSFWTGGCDTEITKAIKVVNQAHHPFAPPPNCGADGQRPCNVWERLPSCDIGYKEDFAAHKCVKLARGEWSPFLAGLKSLGQETAAFSDEALKKLDQARRVCMNTAADFVQQHGHSPFAMGMILPHGVSGFLSPTMEAYVGIGFACSTPQLLGMIAEVTKFAANTVSGGGESFEKEITRDYAAYYDGAECTSAPDAFLRTSCAIAGVVGGAASDGVVCVIRGAASGAFEDFAAGGSRSERALGLTVGQVLYVVGQTYALYRFTDWASGEAKKQINGFVVKSIAKAWDAGTISSSTALTLASGAATVGSIVSEIATFVGGVRTAEGVVGKLGHIRECHMPVTANGRPYRSIVREQNVLYAIDGNGDLLYYRLGPGGRFEAQGVVSHGFGGFRHLTAGDGGDLFAVHSNGNLYYYRLDPAQKFQNWGQVIGKGWALKHVVAGGTVGNEHIVFGVGSDDKLRYYRFEMNGSGTPVFRDEREIGQGWGFAKLFSGGHGHLYAIDNAGALLRYDYDLANPAGATQHRIGTGWNAYRKVFAGTDGAIYGLAADDQLWFYRDTFGRGVAGREYLGFGFAFPHMTASLDR